MIGKTPHAILLPLLLGLAPAVQAAEACGCEAEEQVTPPLSRAGAVAVREFRFDGNRAIATSELMRVSAPFAGRTVSAEELQELRHRLTRLYVDAGYINSGVLLPDQKVQDGIVTFRIIEGRLTDVEVTGSRRLRDDYVIDRLKGGTDEVLNLKQLQERIALLHNDPLIERINAELQPGLAPGEARLRAQVTEAEPLEVSAEINNYRSPSVGAERLMLQALHRDLTGRGDRLKASLGVSDNPNDGGLEYALPLDARDTTLSLYWQRSDNAVVEEPFAGLDIKSLSERHGVALRRPWEKRTDGGLDLGIALEHIRNETTLLGRPFSFSNGADNGVSEVTALRFSQEWLRRDQHQVIAARSTLSVGIDALGATVHPDAADGRFVAWLGQAQWVRRLHALGGAQLLLRADLQLADDELLPSERFALGGHATVRGYRENQLVRDDGWAASVETRIPLGDVAERPVWQLALFADGGQAWNRRGDTATQSLASVGAGLLWDPDRRLHAEIYCGVRLIDVDNPHTNLQDAGIHFALSYRIY